LQQVAVQQPVVVRVDHAQWCGDGTLRNTPHASSEALNAGRLVGAHRSPAASHPALTSMLALHGRTAPCAAEPLQETASGTDGERDTAGEVDDPEVYERRAR
jgi:hypothetical protein